MKNLIYKTLAGKVFTVQYNGRKSLKVIESQNKIAEFKSETELLKNPTVQLSDTTIHIRFKSTLFGVMPSIEEKSVLLYGSTNGAGPEYAINEAFGIGLFIAVLNIIMGVLVLTFPAMADLGYSLEFLIQGGIFLALAFGIKMRYLEALYAYIIALIVLLGIYIALILGQENMPIYGVIIRVVFIMSMVKAIPAMQIVQSQRKYKNDDILDAPI
jgi:hypothetical protein